MAYDPSSGPGWHDLVGLLLAILGFGGTIIALVKTRGATKAATVALQGAQKDLAERQLSLVVADMKAASDELQIATLTENRDLARASLVRFALMTGEARSLTLYLGNENLDLVERLSYSSVAALEAKGRLSATQRTVAKVTKVTADDMSRLWVEMRTVTSDIKNKIGQV
jgi:hypothetical protein